LRKILRIALPPRINSKRRVGITIDGVRPLGRVPLSCTSYVCMADYEAGPELANWINQGRGLSVEVPDKSGSAVNLKISLSGFARAYNGQPQETSVFEEPMAKLEVELADREARCGRSAK
jgi:invasion protein IalB